MDWNSNPTQFDYKTTKDSETKTMTMDSVKEFGIDRQSRFLRYHVDIDRRVNGGGGIGSVKEPVFEKEELFLKVLVEGKATLFSYVDGNFITYFFNKDNQEAEQLIFKEYTSVNNLIHTNDSYKSQLWENVQCPGCMVSTVTNLKYNKKELVKYFENYNSGIKSDFISFEQNQKKKSFYINLRPGISLSTLTLNNSNEHLASRDSDFGMEIGYRAGIEAEFILPFNKNKWAALIEPTFQYLKSENYTDLYRLRNDEYKSMELPFGIRHYFFPNENSKIFLNGAFVLSFSKKTETLIRQPNGFAYDTGTNFAAGLGFKFKNKVSLELNYTNRDFYFNHMYWRSEFSNLSFIAGYTLF
jgi:hypothetical protein